MPFIYLDNSATTKAFPCVIEKMAAVLGEDYGNASSAHLAGRKAAAHIKEARAHIARAIGAAPSEIVFTSGGTEADNLALYGAAMSRQRRGKHIISTKGEHPAVLRTLDRLEELGFEVTQVPLLEGGQPDLIAFENALRGDTILVSAMLVNNELGTIYPLEKMREILRKKKSEAWLHTDAVQALGKIPIQVQHLGIDLMSISAHKVNGPKGCGALYVRKGIRLLPQMTGGGQEAGLRSGTENVAAIAGFGLAVQETMQKMEESANYIEQLRTLLIEQLHEKTPDVAYNSAPKDGVAHIVNLSYPGFKSEVLLNFLDGKGVCVSAASACAAPGKIKSSVLTQAGFSEKRVDSALRISFGWYNTREDVIALADALKEATKTLISASR